MADWKAELDEFFSRQGQIKQAESERKEKELQEAQTFLKEVVLPAFEELKAYLVEHGRDVRLAVGDEHATITVIDQGDPEILYRIYASPPRPRIIYAYIAPETGKAVKASDEITDEAGPVPVDEISQDVIIQHFIRKYKSVPM